MTNFDTYLVRHGHYDHQTGCLNEQGVEDAKKASNRLVELGLIRPAIVLASDKPRGLQTGKIIADSLNVTVLPSRRFNVGGNTPEGVEKLDEWLEKAVEEVDVPLDGFGSLVVVTHEPLIRIAVHSTRNSTRSETIGYGEVVPYVPSSWLNEDFRGYMVQLIEEDMMGEHP